MKRVLVTEGRGLVGSMFTNVNYIPIYSSEESGFKNKRRCR